MGSELCIYEVRSQNSNPSLSHANIYTFFPFFCFVFWGVFCFFFFHLYIFCTLHSFVSQSASLFGLQNSLCSILNFFQHFLMTFIKSHTLAKLLFITIFHPCFPFSVSASYYNFCLHEPSHTSL